MTALWLAPVAIAATLLMRWLLRDWDQDRHGCAYRTCPRQGHHAHQAPPSHVRKVQR